MSVYNPFGNNETGWMSPQYSGGGFSFENGGNYQGGGGIPLQQQLPTVAPFVPLPVKDTSIMQTITKQILNTNPISEAVTENAPTSTPVYLDNKGNITHTPVNDLLEQGKQVVKDNPLASLAVACFLGYMIFGNKGKK